MSSPEVDTDVIQAPAFAQERIAHVWAEALPLIRTNHDETGAVILKDHFNPQLENFKKYEDFGILRTFTMRLDRRLVGYGLFMVSPGLLHPVKWACSLVVYVLPEHRGPNSLRFMQWQDEQLKAEDVCSVERQSSRRKDVSKLYMRLGYSEAQSTWVKVL